MNICVLMKILMSIRFYKAVPSKYVLTLLNSNLINWFYNKTFTNDSTLTVNISKEYLSKIPIKNVSIINQRPFIEKADEMLFLNKELLP